MNTLAHNPENIQPLDLERERVDQLASAANAWLKDVPEIRDEDTARRADDFLNQLTDAIGALDTERLAATKPLRDEQARINRLYEPLLNKLKAAKILLNPLISVWLNKKRAAAEEEKRQQREEASRLAREAKAAEKRAAAGGGDAVGRLMASAELAAQAAAAAELADRPVERAQVRGNYADRARSIRVFYRAEVEDVVLAFAYYQNRREIRDVLTRLASAEVASTAKEDRKSLEIPGCRIVKQEIVA